MQVILNKYFLSLLDEEISDSTMGEFLADILSKAEDGINPFKAIPWAKQLIKNLPVEIDKVDLESLYNYVKLSKHIIPLAKTQLLSELKKLLSE